MFRQHAESSGDRFPDTLRFSGLSSEVFAVYADSGAECRAAAGTAGSAREAAAGRDIHRPAAERRRLALRGQTRSAGHGRQTDLLVPPQQQDVPGHLRRSFGPRGRRGPRHRPPHCRSPGGRRATARSPSKWSPKRPGKPVPDARIFLFYPATSHGMSVNTDSDGSHVFENMNTGPYSPANQRYGRIPGCLV